MVLEVTEVESIERKERDGRGKGNEGFPEHSTHFSLSLSLSPRGQQHRPLDSRRHSWKRNLIREKLNSFKCTSPPSSYSTPPRSRAFPTFLSLSLSFSSFILSRALEGLLLFHPPSTLSIAKTSFCNLLFPFLSHQCFNSPLCSTTHNRDSLPSSSLPFFLPLLCGSSESSF